MLFKHFHDSSSVGRNPGDGAYQVYVVAFYNADNRTLMKKPTSDTIVRWYDYIRCRKHPASSKY